MSISLNPTENRPGRFDLMRPILLVLVAAGFGVAGAQTPPTITVDLTNQAVLVGGNVMFSVSVGGSGPFTYQWFFNAAPLNLISTVAGTGVPGYTGDGGPAANAKLSGLCGVGVDIAGDLFVADTGNCSVRKVGTNGIITTVAGTGAAGYSGDGGAATNATLSEPSGVAVDSSGNLFIADTDNNRIRKVATNGIITTIAGGGDPSTTGDGGPATSAALGFPEGVAVGGLANLFIADTDNCRVRKVAAPASPVLTLTNVGAATAGNYWVVVASPYGSITSAVAVFTVDFPPSITGQPQNRFVTNGSPVAFGVSVGGTPPFSYQWRQNGTNLTDNSNLSGATTSNLTVAVASADNAGMYAVVVTNLFGSVTSAAAMLILGLPPSITIQPASQTVLAGSTAALTVVAAGTGPFTYQWLRNGTQALNNIINTFAGVGTRGLPGAYGGDGGPATNAHLKWPEGAAVDGSGNLFIADSGNNRIRKVAVNGIITTVAGTGVGGYSGDGGAATNAALSGPGGVAVDNSGNLFIADTQNNRVRRVGTNGIIDTFAGTGVAGHSGDGGAATNAEISAPVAVAVDNQGNIFIADSNRIRRVGPDGVITTAAGTPGGGYSGDGGPATNAALNSPFALTLDGAGNLFIADAGNGCIRRVATNGIISTVAGTGATGYSGDDGPAARAELYFPQGVAVDGAGNLFIADTENQRIRKVDTNGLIMTVAGTGATGYSGDGGAAANATFHFPYGLALDRSGNLFITDLWNNCVRAMNPGESSLPLNNVGAADAGTYSVVVSSPYGGATSTVATLTVLVPPTIVTQPQSVTLLAGGTAALDVTATGTGPLEYQWYFDGIALPGATNSALTVSPFASANAGAYQVVVTNLWGVTTSAVATLTQAFPPAFVVQPSGQTVLPGSDAILGVAVSGTGPFSYQWQLNGTNLPAYIITTVAGTGGAGYSGDGGPAASAKLSAPNSLAVDDSGYLFIADADNNRIRQVAPDGSITTVAGTGQYGYSGDGGAATNAQMFAPEGVAVDHLGNLLIADTKNCRIREVTTNGIIYTVAGDVYCGHSGDGGPATNAWLNWPSGVAVDGVGNLFIADTWNSRVRRVRTNGIITTVAGDGNLTYSGDGGPATSAGLNWPSGVAVDSVGNLFIADTWNNRVRQVDTNGIISTAATGTELYQPAGVAVDGSGNLFIADTGNNYILQATTNGTLSTVAGTGLAGFSGDGGPATSAKLNAPGGIVVDNSGNLFIADTGNNRIRKATSLNQPTLALNTVGATNAGNYTVIVSTPYGSITSAVAPLTVALAPLSIVPAGEINSASAIQFQFSGAPVASYVLQYTTNLSPPPVWLPIVTNSTAVNGDWIFTLTNLAAFPAQFFRIAEP